MKGLPLNWQLTERNAVFETEARTAKKYELYAFESEKKPGLIQVTSDTSDGRGFRYQGRPRTNA